MANKRTVKKRPSNSVKKKNTRSSFLRGEILAIGSACIGIFLIVSIWFGGGGLIGSGITYFLKGVFGDIAFLIPIFVVAVAAILWVMRSQAAGFKLVVLTLSLIELSVMKHYMYRVGNPEIPNGVEGLFHAGCNGIGGGVAGGVIAEPLMALLGNMGSFLFLIAIFLVLIVLLFEISVTRMLASAFQRVKGSLREFAQSVREYGEEDRPQLLQMEEEPQAKKKKHGQEQVELELYDWQKNKEEIVIHDPLSQMQQESESLAQKEEKKERPKKEAEKPPKESQQPKTQEPEQTQGSQEEAESAPKKEYIYPSAELLTVGKQSFSGNSVEQLKENAQKLVEILSSFGIEVKVTNITRGSSITRYEILPAAGVKVNKITALDQDIALRLPANNVRIEVLAGSIAIEVSNESVSAVYLRGLIEGKEFMQHKSKLAVALGKDINGDNVVIDIAKTPHLLIAGQTGSGKSVCINTIITSILYKASPDEVKLVMVDPKVVELGMYNGIPHLLVPIVTDPRKAAGALCWAVNEMEERYQAFAEKSVRDLTGYNHKQEEEGLEKLPQIVIIIDELADLMMVAPGEVQDYICRLAQKARAAGMHLVLATQRPSVDVITGIIKANIPSRISFAVSSQIDSRTILDHSGAEKLIGKGDMLLMMNGASKLRRIQGAFVSDEDIERLVSFVKEQSDGAAYSEDILKSIESGSVKENKKSGEGSSGEEDELFVAAAQIAFEMNQISASMLQRRLKVGYARAGRLVDLLESKHVISPYDGSNKPRTVIMGKAEFDEMMEKE